MNYLLNEVHKTGFNDIELFKLIDHILEKALTNLRFTVMTINSVG